MDRRDFIKSSTALAVTAAIPAAFLQAAPLQAAPVVDPVNLGTSSMEHNPWSIVKDGDYSVLTFETETMNFKVVCTDDHLRDLLGQINGILRDQASEEAHKALDTYILAGQDAIRNS